MVDKLTEPPEWSRLMEEALTMPGHLSGIYNRFYVYSFNNQILLWMQGVTEPVATYNRWKQLGRQVKRGSKAKAILRPIIIKLPDELDEHGNPRQVTRFKLVNALFTVSETEGDDLPAYEPPAWSEDAALASLDITRVPFDMLDGNVQGFSFERNVAISPVAAYPLKTLFHELAHVVLGHTDKAHAEEYRLHRGIKEFQAEATAHLCMNDVGAIEHMDASGSRGYIRQWLGEEKPSDQAIREVFKAVDQILRAGHPQAQDVAA